MIDLYVRPDYEPTGVCEMAWQAGLGQSRHYCDNAATCELVIHESAYLSCDVCLLELIKSCALQLQGA